MSRNDLETYVKNSDNYMVTVLKTTPHRYYVRVVCADNEGNSICFQHKAEQIKDSIKKVGWSNFTCNSTQLCWEVPSMANKILGDLLGKFCCVLSGLLRNGDKNAHGLATVHVDFAIPLKTRV